MSFGEEIVSYWIEKWSNERRCPSEGGGEPRQLRAERSTKGSTKGTYGMLEFLYELALGRDQLVARCAAAQGRVYIARLLYNFSSVPLNYGSPTFRW